MNGPVKGQPRWPRDECEFVRDYMPPVPNENTRPMAVVVRHIPSDSMLRYSHGPGQGHFWDCYGDDYQTIELATVALDSVVACDPLVLTETETADWRTMRLALLASGMSPAHATDALEAQTRELRSRTSEHEPRDIRMEIALSQALGWHGPTSMPVMLAEVRRLKLLDHDEA